MRKDQQLAEGYRKNKRFEDVLTSMNEQLSESQKKILVDLKENYSTIHILGAPRSGTTLVSQLIPSFLEVAHINNLIAAFWKAPIYGIELSKKLLTEKYRSSFSSDYGRTKNINEPHEFGYFWNYHLKYNELSQKTVEHEKDIDWQSLAYLIKNMTNAFAKPIVFKSFLLGFHAATFHKNLPKTKFIYIKRNLVDNVLSIKKLREQLNGNVNTWGSIKPKQYEKLKNLNVYEQIVGQIFCLENEYLKQLENIPQANKMIVSYEEICNDPKHFLNQINKTFFDGKCNLDIQDFPDLQIKPKEISNKELDKINKAKKSILELFPKLNILEI